MSRNQILLVVGLVVGVVGVCAGGVALLFFWVFSVTGQAADGADRFLALVAQGKVAEAYNSAAAGLRARQSQEAFAARVKEMGLTEWVSSSWNSRNVVNDQATVEGSVTTRGGGTIPLKITLVHES